MFVTGKARMYDKPGFFSNAVFTLTKNNIDSYEVIDESKSKSVGSAVARGAVGTLFLGPVGLLAVASAKNKGTYMVAVNWKNSKRSLLEIDEKCYKSLVTECF